jgi:ABC-type transport system involved in multi-copper enzyme maturation permease subunit
MSGNEAFDIVSGYGWDRGLDNLLRSGLARWFRTRMWWSQCLIWGGIMGILISGMVFNSQPPGFLDLLMIFAVFAGLFPAVGVTIIMQDALVGEKREGTAAWVLSKPVTRQAFVLSKVISNSVGILVTMVVVPCTLAYVLISLTQQPSLDLLGFIVAMGVIFISHFFFLSLTLLLGAFFSNRGPVIAIPLAILFFQQNLLGLLPSLRYVLPWTLALPIGNMQPLVLSLMMRTQVQSDHLITLGAVVAESILFVLIALWRFNQEEF